MNEVSVGIIGARFAADLHTTSYSRLTGVRIAAICDKDEATVKEFASARGIPDYYTDYRPMLERKDIDLISVCVPNFLHHEMVLAAAEAGKDIICEKPLATKLSDAEEMVAVCREAGVKLMYAEDWIFAPSLVRAEEIYKEGAIGEALYITGKESHSGSHSPFAMKKEYCGGGAMIHLGIHPIGYVLHFVAEAPEKVVGVVSGGNEANLLHPQFEGEDWAVGILDFPSGVKALVEGNYITQGGMDDRLEIYGTEGVIRVDLTQGSPISVYSGKGFSYAIEKADMTAGWTRPAIDEYWSLGYQNEIAHFVAAVRDDKELPIGVRPEDGLLALKVTTAIYESAASGQAVRLS
ncbi:Gfo/Idh/MocA family protein [candidate division KSB1 bacterium]